MQHPTMESLLRELRRNAELPQVCGFNVIHGSEAVPTPRAMSRFVANVVKEEALLREMHARVGLALAVMLAMAVGFISQGRPELMRSLVGSTRRRRVAA